MKRFYLDLNTLPSGEYPLHKEGCAHLPKSYRENLGVYGSTQEAVDTAMQCDPKNRDRKVAVCEHYCS